MTQVIIKVFMSWGNACVLLKTQKRLLPLWLRSLFRHIKKKYMHASNSPVTWSCAIIQVFLQKSPNGYFTIKKRYVYYIFTISSSLKVRQFGWSMFILTSHNIHCSGTFSPRITKNKCCLHHGFQNNDQTFSIHNVSIWSNWKRASRASLAR